VSAPIKRADARRNAEAIVEAATELLARNPDASINEIAAAAGVGRVTLYGHFESRAVLVAEVATRAMSDTEAALTAIDVSGDPVEALSALVRETWHLTHRFGALVAAAEHSLAPDQLAALHEQPVARVRTLLRRGRKAGEFRADQSLAWQLTAIQAILHAASTAVHQGVVPEQQAPDLVVGTVLALLRPA